MERHELTPIIEALLFASDQPLTVNALVKAIDDETVDRASVREVLDILREHYDDVPRGFQILRMGNGYQLLTRDRFSPWIDNLITVKRRTRLSRAALETVAVIAYKQPLSRLEIERIRGVDAGGVLSTLLERGLIMIKGRDPGPGRPLLYGSTQAFLEYFGLSSLSDLPRLDELAALAGIDREAWNDTERARFEKVGVDAAEVPEIEELFEDEDSDDEFPEEDAEALEAHEDAGVTPEPGETPAADAPDPEDSPSSEFTVPVEIEVPAEIEAEETRSEHAES